MKHPIYLSNKKIMKHPMYQVIKKERKIKRRSLKNKVWRWSQRLKFERMKSKLKQKKKMGGKKKSYNELNLNKKYFNWAKRNKKELGV